MSRMAEFQDVMRQWVRARKATASSCEENVLSVYPLETYDDALIADIERNVMQWAADHPEPVYPTWAEWLLEVGGGVEKLFEAGGYSGNTYVADLETVVVAHNTQIPADTAHMLGVKPKKV